MRWVATLAICLIAAPALAGMPPGMRNPQVRPANASAGLPAVNDNLAAGGYPISGGICSEWGHQVPCNNHYATTRASTKYVSASDGLFVSVPSNVQAMGSGNGSLIEEARTNDALWSRDMTNAVWVKTTMTTALNAVGIDGNANSATMLTATGASAMAVQTITLASQADNYSVFLKRVTGSGTINICLAATACASPTACTVTSTTTFTLCTVTATVLNPIVGVQIVTNGDAVIADFNQMEPGGFATSPILTTMATATRSSDNIQASGLLLTTLAGSSYSITAVVAGLPTSATGQRIIATDNGSSQTPMQYSSSTKIGTYNGSVDIDATMGSGTSASTVKAAFGQSSSGRSIVANNGAVVSDANVLGAVNQASIGSQNGTAVFIDTYLSRLSAMQERQPDATLKALTQ